MKTRLILVGGFLGAGKTTLLWESAQRLISRGKRVGLITNDQAPELVDTALLSRGEPSVAEVSGSCFCCNFPGLLDAMEKLQTDANAEMLIAEPVGSCTDLSATIIQPLKDRLSEQLAVAPLTVLANPARLADILAGGTADLHRSAAYIYRKQLEEADIILIAKTDTLAIEDAEELRSKTAAAYPLAKVLLASAQTGEGMDAWLEAVTNQGNAGLQLAEVDYDIYAEGEAVLGWLNASFKVEAQDANWNEFARSLLAGLSKRFDERGAAVGHVKLIIESDGGFVVGNLTGDGSSLNLRSSGTIEPAARLTLNARVEMTPETLEQIVRKELEESAGPNANLTQLAWRCLSPGRPTPTHRYDHVVAGT